MPTHLGSQLLVAMLVIPFLGSLLGTILPRSSTGKWFAIIVSLLTSACGLAVACLFDWKSGGMQFQFYGPAIEEIGFSFSLGVDTLSLLLVLLTCLLHPLATTASFRSIRVRTREHYAWFNLLLLAMLGVFMARDALLFYMFFEVSLVPLFFIVGIWGGAERRLAASRLFLYTFTGGVFTLAAILYLGLRAGTFDIPSMVHFAQGATLGNTLGMTEAFTANERFWVLIGLLCGLGIKTPLFPLHTWLPLAHTEAPTAGSVDLAALVLKLGTYGLLRLALPIGIINFDGSISNANVLQFLAILCLIGIIYGALVAWVQTDIKKLIAYSSVSHLGFCVLGMLSLQDWGLAGSMLYMVNHGISTGAMFLLIGAIYNRYHTRDMTELSGLAKAMPRLAFFWVLFVMASVGLPGTNGFVSEFLTILGAFTAPHLGIVYGVVASTGIVLGAIYMLHMTAKVIFGPLHYPPMHEHAEDHATIHPKYVTGGDLTGREMAILTPLAVLVIVLGVFPGPILRSMKAPLDAIKNPSSVTAALAHPKVQEAVADASRQGMIRSAVEPSE